MSEIVKPERSGWRDERISRRHRTCGVACPATDIDFLLVETAGAEPKAIIEYKHERADLNYGVSYQYVALRKLAFNARLPFFVVQYADDFSWFKVYSMNDLAKNYVYDSKSMSELEFVKLLYLLRNKEMPQEVVEALIEL